MDNKGVPENNQESILRLEKELGRLESKISDLEEKNEHTRKALLSFRSLFSESKAGFEANFDRLKESLAEKTNHNDVMNSIMEVIRLYDLGKLPRPWRS